MENQRDIKDWLFSLGITNNDMMTYPNPTQPPGCFKQDPITRDFWLTAVDLGRKNRTASDKYLIWQSCMLQFIDTCVSNNWQPILTPSARVQSGWVAGAFYYYRRLALMYYNKKPLISRIAPWNTKVEITINEKSIVLTSNLIGYTKLHETDAFQNSLRRSPFNYYPVPQYFHNLMYSLGRRVYSPNFLVFYRRIAGNRIILGYSITLPISTTFLTTDLKSLVSGHKVKYSVKDWILKNYWYPVVRRTGYIKHLTLRTRRF